MSYERTCLDIFTGLGCFSIAARANGVRTVGMCEIKADCRHFLAANWPGVAIHDNAKTLDGTRYKGVWLVCGGPPCQPASVAGEQRGAADHRWLWPEAVRIVGESEPTWFLFENPPGIRSVGLDGVLADLEAQGYEVGVLNIPACAVDAPHRRERLWIVGHRLRERLGERGSSEVHGQQSKGWIRPKNPNQSRALGHAKGQPQRVQDLQALSDARGDARGVALPAVECSHVANTPSLPGAEHGHQQGEGLRGRSRQDHTADNTCTLANRLRGELEIGQGDSGDPGIEQQAASRDFGLSLWSESVWIECGDGKRRRSKPGVRGVVNGPAVGLLEALGNAIVWPIAARAIAAMIQAEEL